MPKKTPYKKLDEGLYEFEQNIKINNYDCRILTPKEMGDEIGHNKRVKVTVEVLKDD